MVRCLWEGKVGKGVNEFWKKTEEQDFISEVGIKSWREDLVEEERRSLDTSSGVTGKKFEIGLPVNGQSEYWLEDVRDDILAWMECLRSSIFAAKNLEKVAQRVWI